MKSLSPGSLKTADVAVAAGPGAASPAVARHLRDTSLTRALDVLGDWWTQRILRESFLGVRQFDVFQRHLGIPRQTLSVRLRSLVDDAILDSTADGYRLTKKGLALYPWALMIWRWSSHWGGGRGPRHPARLVHADCGHATLPVFTCAACRKEVGLRDVDCIDGPRSRSRAADMERPARRWTGDRFVMDSGDAGHNIAFLTADRWTHLILSAAYLGCRSFDVMQREIGIATNILAQRLALLVEAGFFVKTRSSADARRFDYRLTPRSRDVFPLTITLVQWADRWLDVRRMPSMTRIHRACGQPLQAIVACSHCHLELLPRRVSYSALKDASIEARGVPHA